MMSQHYIFKRLTNDNTSSTTVEHMCTFADEATWVSVMMNFAAFLDSCGYMGVYDRMEDFLKEIDE